LAGCVSLEEAPILVRYEPSAPEVVNAMLELAAVTDKDVVYDLGCGDGRIVIAAASATARAAFASTSIRGALRKHATTRPRPASSSGSASASRAR